MDRAIAENVQQVTVLAVEVAAGRGRGQGAVEAGEFRYIILGIVVGLGQVRLGQGDAVGTVPNKRGVP